MVLWAVIVNGRQGALWRRAVGVYGGHIGLLEVITVSGRQGALWGSMGVWESVYGARRLWGGGSMGQEVYGVEDLWGRGSMGRGPTVG